MQLLYPDKNISLHFNSKKDLKQDWKYFSVHDRKNWPIDRICQTTFSSKNIIRTQRHQFLVDKSWNSLKWLSRTTIFKLKGPRLRLVVKTSLESHIILSKFVNWIIRILFGSYEFVDGRALKYKSVLMFMKSGTFFFHTRGWMTRFSFCEGYWVPLRILNFPNQNMSERIFPSFWVDFGAAKNSSGSHR